MEIKRRYCKARGLPTSQLWKWKDGKQVKEWVKYNDEEQEQKNGYGF